MSGGKFTTPTIGSGFVAGQVEVDMIHQVDRRGRRHGGAEVELQIPSAAQAILHIVHHI